MTSSKYDRSVLDMRPRSAFLMIRATSVVVRRHVDGALRDRWLAASQRACCE